VSYGRLDKLLQARNSWPKWLNSAIDSVADKPTGVIGRLASLRYRPRGPLPDVSKSNKNVFTVAIGPVNYSNQGTLWGKSLSRIYPEVSTSTFAIEVPGGFNFPSDAIIPMDFYQRSSRWQKAQIDALSKFSHVLVEAEEPLVGRLFHRSIEKESIFLKNCGVSVAYIAHGTDVRIPDKHAKRTKWSPYLDPTMYINRLNTIAKKNVDYLNSTDNPVFVSTPDLLLDLPNAQWCPVVVDIEKWSKLSETSRRPGPIRVVHAPSVKKMKGTHLIEPVLNKLHQQGIIEYRELRGVPSQEMPEAISWADVVLDQFRLGSYGVAAVEAMAAHKVVIGHIIPEVRELIQGHTGLELPIIEATPNTLELVLVDLVANPMKMEDLKSVGGKYASRLHDGGLSAEILMNNWIKSVQQEFIIGGIST
jgi:glycosyltransferase involved in cell wall biosynthesis